MSQTSVLEQLKSMTTLVADTGDVNAISQFMPIDATTNPSLLLKAAGMEKYQGLIQNCIATAKKNATDQDARIKAAADAFAIQVGAEILAIIPGRVSTEVDARLSFQTDAMVQEARRISAAYLERGFDQKRILIKIAATWEGIMAAKILEAEGIGCNLTLMFNFAQALACANAKVTLVSPFVGRIFDWYTQKTGETYTPDNDPGVLSVKRIYEYYRKFDINTIVMGASFRNIGQIKALSGCDYLTISPALLQQLDSEAAPLVRTLSKDKAKAQVMDEVFLDEASFRWQMNEDAMATEKLAEGIRLFNQDLLKLYAVLSEKF